MQVSAGSALIEVFGGGTPYTDAGGSHSGMIGRHLGCNLTEAQRKRWIALMLETADEVGLPDDPEFRAALVGYLEWGTRIAVINSQPGIEPPKNNPPMPSWGWGPPGGPYRG
jgi:hemoglobin